MPSASPSRASSTSSLLYMRTPSPGPPRSRSNFLSASPDDLREHVPLVADEAAAQPHDRLVQPQADDGECDEDDKLARPREPLSVREHVAHGRDVVEHGGHAVRDARRDNRRQIRQLGEDHHDTEVYDESDDAHDAELKELLHKPLEVHPMSPVPAASIPAFVETHDIELPVATVALHHRVEDKARDTEQYR